jgi:hypothetical protein
MRRPIAHFLVLALGLPALHLSLLPVAMADSEADRAKYKLHLDTLADPALEGRGPGLTGNRTAAEYLEQQFQALGLQPAFPSGHRPGGTREEPSYYQQFNAGRQVKINEAVVSFTPVGENVDERVERQTLTMGQDYTVLGSSGSATAEGELVFVGYSIEAGEGPGAAKAEDASYGESDDLTGKIAVMFRFEPLNEVGKSRLSEKGGWSNASAISGKIMGAVKRNAAGIILVSPPGVDDKRAGKLEKPEVSATWTRALDIPAVMLSQQAAERLVKAADGRTLWELRKLADKARAGLSEDQSALIAMPKVRVRLAVASERVDRVTWNIGGILPGKGDLASEFVVIGGHFDHVGYGYTGGSRSNELGVVHPGADDNASGTSGLLLSAEVLARTFGNSDTPRRSVLFLGFSAEEMGLIGSREYIKASPVDAKAISIMLNMDMIGRLRDNKLMIAGTGTAEGFADLLKPIFDASGLTIDASPGGRGPSDHATFYGAGVPVLHFFTGLHEEYHTPRDTADLINVEGAVRITEMVCDIATQLATRPEQLAFTSTDRGGRRAAADPDAGPSMRSVRVRFGIAPANYAEGGDGVGVGEVFDGTSAADAGIRVGDRLTRWNGEPLEDVQGWMSFLTKHKPGDVVDVTLVRPKDPKNTDAGSEEIVVRVTLKARDQEAR